MEDFLPRVLYFAVPCRILCFPPYLALQPDKAKKKEFTGDFDAAVDGSGNLLLTFVFFLSCYRPQRSWGKVIFSQASVILSTGGRAWLLVGGVHSCQGSMLGCWGACVVARACMVVGGMCGCGGHLLLPGACVVAGGCAWLWGHVWLLGACIVAGGCAWLPGGMHGCQGARVVARGMCMVARGYAWLLGTCMVAGEACMVAGGHV